MAGDRGPGGAAEANVIWEELGRRRLVVRAPRGSYAAGVAPAVLREAEKALEALEELLEPPERAPVEIHLVDSMAGTPAGFDLSPDEDGMTTDTIGERGIVRIVQPDLPAGPIAAPLTRYLVSRWFGPGAAGAEAIVAGLGGVVAARTEAGPSVAEADEWVRGRVLAGRAVSVLGGDRVGMEEPPPGMEEPPPGEMEGPPGEMEGPPPGMAGPSGETDEGEEPPGGGAGGFREVDPSELAGGGPPLDLPGMDEIDAGGMTLAATSFVSYLIARFGAGSLKTLFESYEEARPDHAANAAFQQPLGALEETWLGTFRSVGGGVGIRTFLKYLVPLFRPYWGRQIEVLIYMFVASAFAVVSLPVATGAVIGALGGRGGGPPQEGGGFLAGIIGDVRDWLASGNTLSKLITFIFILLGIYLFEALISMRRAIVSEGISQRLLLSLQERLFDHMQRLPHSFYGQADVGDLMARMSGDLQVVSMAMTQVLDIGLLTVISLMVALVGVFGLHLQLGAVVLIVVPIFLLTYKTLGGRLSKVSYERMARSGEAAAVTQENLSAHAVIKAFGMEERARASYRARLNAVLKASLRQARLSSLYEASSDVAITLAELLVLGYGGYLVIDGQLEIGVLVAFLGLLPSLLGPISQFSDIGEIVQTAAGSLARVTELLEQPLPIADERGATPLPPLQSEIRMEDVTFGYQPEEPILQNFDLTIAAGENVAIVGPSGSGKSTVLNLLMRFWDPQEGGILVDGQDIRRGTLASLRGQIGLVFQETFIFDTTVRDNIAIGRPDASDEEIVAAAKGARLHDYIDTLPLGYDTVLGERGTRMSGGQRQRLAIARVLLRNPRLMMLDEATSALDAETEAEIRKTLDEAAKGRTTISITHRLMMAMTADRVIVLDRGRLVEQGPHDELVRAGGVYQRLYETQMRHAVGAAGPDGTAPGPLRGIPLFADLSEEAIAALAEGLREEELPAGRTVVRQGEAGDTLYLVAEGELDVVVDGEGGERRVATLGPGEYFGEMALLAGGVRTATVRTTAASRLLSLDRASLQAVLAGHPGLRRALTDKAAERASALAEATAAAGPPLST